MKIIRKGRVPDEVWEGECDTCHTVAQAEKKEIHQDESASKDEEIEVRWGRCPLAGCHARMLFRRKVD